jgi:hypothetical protein
MAYHFENGKLEKGMYNQTGMSFPEGLEKADPSENYIGTPIEGLDAYQRQLKRFDIKVRGAGSDPLKSSSAAPRAQFCSRIRPPEA